MAAPIQTLKADISADVEAITDIYAALDRCPIESATTEDDLIIIGYFLHNLYCAFESIFQSIVELFENQISDQAGWHAQLLRRMRLDIEGIRPRLLSDEAYDALDELRRFRHLFRSAYRSRLDLERLILVHNKASRLRHVYTADIERFVDFLDSLLRAEDAAPTSGQLPRT